MPRLAHHKDGKFVRELKLGLGTLRIGRLPENDICLTDLIVSGRHAKITVTNNENIPGTRNVVVEDLGSTNGTMVDGQPVMRHRLRNREVVRIGADEFIFIDDASGSAPAAE
jgi:pSer/pThr/pTyr-binding forkhead associated (FHA) protein